MVELWIESIYVVGMGIGLIKIFYQVYSSKKEGRSINTVNYWLLVALSNALIGVHGFFLGSLVIPVANALSFIYIFYHINLELNRNA